MSNPAGPELRRARWVVAVVGLLALVGKLTIAATTRGTNDVRIYTSFARTIARVGPVNVYGVKNAGIDLYNHGPVTGLLLDLASHLARHGASITFMIRVPACLGDLLTCLLVFELVRMRSSLRYAVAAGIAVSLSPVLIAVSGFHGNTDPFFVSLILLSAWLLSARRLPTAAGAALGLALCIKIVPVVVLPALLIAALRRGRGDALRFSAALAIVCAAFWALPMLEYFPQVKANVFEYAGEVYRPWGLPQFATWAGLPPHLTDALIGSGRFAVVLLAAGLGAYLSWRRPQAVGAAVGLALGTFLLLSPAGAAQYLAWPAAGLLVAEFWGGLAYNLIAGAFLVKLYTNWSDGFPWDIAHSRAFSQPELVFAALIWAVLAIVIATSTRAVLALPPPVDTPPNGTDAASYTVPQSV